MPSLRKFTHRLRDRHEISQFSEGLIITPSLIVDAAAAFFFGCIILGLDSHFRGRSYREVNDRGDKDGAYYNDDLPDIACGLDRLQVMETESQKNNFLLNQIREDRL